MSSCIKIKIFWMGCNEYIMSQTVTCLGHFDADAMVS